MPLPRLGPARLALVALLLTPLAACSDDADPVADPTSSPTPRSEGPTTDPTPEPEPEPEPTNPCDLIDQADYAQLAQPGDRPFLVETPELSTTVEPYYVCGVSVNGYPFLSFGYSLADQAYSRTMREVREFDTVRSLKGLGDRAFYTDTSVFPAAYAEIDGQTITFGISLLRSRRSILADPLRLLLTNVEEKGGITVGPTLDTGEGCPPATSNAVRRVIGQVAYARGGPDRHGVPQCTYRSSPGRRTILTMGATYYDKERFDEEQAGGVFEANGIDLGVDLDLEVTDPPPGRVEDVLVGSDGAVRVRTIYPEARVFASVTTRAIGIDGGSVAGTTAAVRRLAPYWQRAAEPAIGRYRPYTDGRQPQRD